MLVGSWRRRLASREANSGVPEYGEVLATERIAKVLNRAAVGSRRAGWRVGEPHVPVRAVFVATAAVTLADENVLDAVRGGGGEPNDERCGGTEAHFWRDGTIVGFLKLKFEFYLAAERQIDTGVEVVLYIAGKRTGHQHDGVCTCVFSGPTLRLTARPYNPLAL
jgi:hypothetical protein